MADMSKRYFLQGLARSLGRALAIYQKEYSKVEQEAEKASFFDSYENSYPLTLAEDDLLLDAAERAGIEIEGRDKLEISRELFEKQGL
jgi:Sec-independent protein translocase protein TatA